VQVVVCWNKPIPFFFSVCSSHCHPMENNACNNQNNQQDEQNQQDLGVGLHR
jgi:hypothetical protein